MKIIVKNCRECPFTFMSGYESEEYSCSIDEKKRNVFKRNLKKHLDLIKFEDEKEWCPLKKEIVTILR